MTFVINTRRAIFIGLFIFFQTVLAISGGMLTLYMLSGKDIPKGVLVDGVDVGGLKKVEAVTLLQKHYDSIIANNFLSIKINNAEEFKLKLSDINLSIDYDKTIGRVYGENSEKTFFNFISGHVITSRRTVSPDVTLNEQKLVSKLNEISLIVNKDPVNANIYLKDGAVVKVAETNGIKLNLLNSAEKIKREIGSKLESQIDFKSANNHEIEIIMPQITLSDLKDVDEIVAEHTTKIPSGEQMDSVKLASYAINKILVLPADTKSGAESGEFSFNKYLALTEENGIMEKNNEGYNQVISTLYAAILKTGINPAGITRSPAKAPPGYIEPGLDAVVFGKKTDFKFKNTLQYRLVIFSAVKEDKLTVYIVSRKTEGSKNDLKVEVDQKFEPPVINVENNDLRNGETRIINPGKEGMKVSIYRVVTKDNGEVDKKFMYSEKYDAVEAVRQIGPNTNWYNTNQR